MFRGYGRLPSPMPPNVIDHAAPPHRKGGRR
jgi:hypothetical protein